MVLDMILFFNDTATTEIYTYGHTLSLHDALPIYAGHRQVEDQQHDVADVEAGDQAPDQFRLVGEQQRAGLQPVLLEGGDQDGGGRSEEHTSELQSLMRISYAVFCLKKKTQQYHTSVHRQTSVNTQLQHTHS